VVDNPTMECTSAEEGVLVLPTLSGGQSHNEAHKRGRGMRTHAFNGAFSK